MSWHVLQIVQKTEQPEQVWSSPLETLSQSLSQFPLLLPVIVSLHLSDVAQHQFPPAIRPFHNVHPVAARWVWTEGVSIDAGCHEVRDDRC